jgi:hypothetical protein
MPAFSSPPTVALLVAFGPEVRSFMFSGFAEELSKCYKVVVIAANPQSAAFHNLAGAPVAMPLVRERGALERFRRLAVAAHEFWLASRGRQRWRHHLGVSGKGGKAKALGAFLARSKNGLSAVVHLERVFGTCLGTHPNWAQMLRERRVDCLVVSSISSARTLPALQTAVNLGLRVVGILNSWKDAYANPFVHVAPHYLGVWSEKVKEDLLEANPHLDAQGVRVVGSLHLGPLLQIQTVLSRQEFCRLVGLDPDRPIVCYTAASPAAVRNEELVVDALARGLTERYGTRAPQILLRLNPMEDGKRFAKIAEGRPDVVIQRPQWEWLPHADWCAPLPGDLASWAATVHHAAVNVSIPSTVTTEFACLGKPVVNVCFDLPASLPEPESNRRFWYADFYAEARAMAGVTPAWSPAELVEKVASLIENGAGWSDKVTWSMFGNPVEKAVSLVREACHA